MTENLKKKFVDPEIEIVELENAAIHTNESDAKPSILSDSTNEFTPTPTTSAFSDTSTTTSSSTFN